MIGWANRSNWPRSCALPCACVSYLSPKLVVKIDCQKCARRVCIFNFMYEKKIKLFHAENEAIVTLNKCVFVCSVLLQNCVIARV